MLLLLSCLLFFTPVASALQGGEIGNAYVPFESAIGKYKLEYPRAWGRADLSSLNNFYDPSSTKPDFLSVATAKMVGIHTTPELEQYLRFFRPEGRWQATEFAGLAGFVGEENGVKVLYLLRQSEHLLSVRYRATESEKSEGYVRHILGSFQLL